MESNEYSKHYYEIIEESIKSPPKSGEVHHIIPHALGGSDESHNLVLLTLENHWKVHTLLPFFTEGNDRKKMIYAWNLMSNRTGLVCEEYKDLKEAWRKNHSEIMTGKVSAVDKNTGKIIRVTLDEFYASTNLVGNKKGFKHSDITKKKMSVAHKGSKRSQKTKNKMSKARKAFSVVVNDGTRDITTNSKDLSTFLISGCKIGSISKGKKKTYQMAWFKHPETNESWRGNPTDAPKGFVRGRARKGKFQGFDMVNLRNK